MDEQLDTEDWRLVKEQKQAKKRKNQRESTDTLLRNGVEFDSFNNGNHLVIRHGDNLVDYWPSTGKFIFRNSAIKGRGVFGLLKKLGIKK